MKVAGKWVDLENNKLSVFTQAPKAIVHACSHVDPSVTYLQLHVYFVVQVEAAKLAMGH